MQFPQETDMMACLNLILREGPKEMIKSRRLSFLFAGLLGLSLIVAPVFGRLHLRSQEDHKKQDRPWMNTTLSPHERADLLLKEMTLDEKIGLVHGNGMPGW